MARWAPGLLSKAYGMRRARLRRAGRMTVTAIKYSIVIATYNRAADLRDTLASLASLQPDGPWEVLVVDNNSTDATRQVVEEAARTFPVAAALPLRARAGTQPRAQRRDPGGPRLHHRHDRRRRAGAGGLAEPGGRGARAAAVRLRRRPGAADLGRAAPRVDSESRRQAVGGDRAARLRRGSDRVRIARAARREHGLHARRLRSRRPLRSAHRAPGGHAARTGSARVVHPRAQGRRARLLRAGHGAASTSSRPTGCARRTSGAGSTGAGSAGRCCTSAPGSTWKRRSRPCSISRRSRTSRACRDTCIGRRSPTWSAGCAPRCAETPSRRSITKSGSGSSPAS